MIVIYHQGNKVVEVFCDRRKIDFSNKNIVANLFEIAVENPEQLIVWCLLDLKPNLNFSAINDVFHHQKIIASYSLSESMFLSDAIGYVEDSPFIKINKKVSYPTWRMSSDVGGVHASVLLALKNELNKTESLDYFLNSIAKLAMPNGLLCYSEPKLLIDISNTIEKQKSSLFVLFRFVKQHYKTRWVFLLFLNLFLYERKLAVLPFLFSLFYSKRELNKKLLEKIIVQSTKKVSDERTIDVIIPTIGRKKYLYDVLKDLARQTHLPKNVIIVEQNPDLGSVSELSYVTDEKWPFLIKHTFIHQAGACNARNIALSQVESEWVFLNDDDNRFDSNLLYDIFCKIEQYGILTATTSYILKKEKLVFRTIHQTSIFGSGNSFVKSSCLKNILFSMPLELGYGEDTDFGLQLRNTGIDVIYFPEPSVLHLKAPIGGFRIKPAFAWSNEVIQPKPSPTVMYVKLKYNSLEQINGYKTVLFFKFYKMKSIRNPFRYFKKFITEWEQSVYWANELVKSRADFNYLM